MKKVLLLFTFALITMSSAVANEIKVETTSNGVVLTETVLAAAGMSCYGPGWSVLGTQTDSIISLYDSNGRLIGRKIVSQAQGNGICARAMQ